MVIQKLNLAKSQDGYRSQGDRGEEQTEERSKQRST